MNDAPIKGYKTFNKIKRAGMFLSGLAVFFMMIYTTLDVAIRNIFGMSILYSYEITQFYLMPLAVFPALAYAFGVGIMPRIDLFVQKIKEQYQLFVAILLISVELVLMLLLAWFGYEYLTLASARGDSFTAGTFYYPLNLIIFFVPIGFLLVAVEMAFLLAVNIKYKKPNFKVIEDQK